jgi:hypothetical protein
VRRSTVVKSPNGRLYQKAASAGPGVFALRRNFREFGTIGGKTSFTAGEARNLSLLLCLSSQNLIFIEPSHGSTSIAPDQTIAV